MVKAQRLKVGERVTAADDKMRIAFFIVVMLFFLLDYLSQSMIALMIAIPTIDRQMPMKIVSITPRVARADSVSWFSFIM